MNNSAKRIIFLTGASGVGKTTIVTELAQKAQDSPWEYRHFDDIGIPPVEDMIAEYGSTSEWQKATVERWIKILLTEIEADRILFEGQVNLQFIAEGFAKNGFSNYQTILVDCDEDTMARRLSEDRDQPELLTPDMRNWLAYLRNQAQEMGVPILDTSRLTLVELLEKAEKLFDMF
jgi:tRNA uridine 5-carbamoylmethylation protein Kti12